MRKSNHKAVPISLVLGSGGARGLAHIGVIRWLEENGYTIKSTSGCSIGALIGGVYAAGKLDELEQWMNAITRLDMVALMDLSFDGAGLLKGEKIIKTLHSRWANALSRSYRFDSPPWPPILSMKKKCGSTAAI